MHVFPSNRTMLPCVYVSSVKDDNMCQIIIRLWEQKIVKQLQKMIKLPNPGEDARYYQSICVCVYIDRRYF